ncbi:MAG: hypothetical protein EPO10_23690 [Reyranella sp.]|uniref:hypothetical protein n=1 Tax=Reyranella sp. TaxID=1929291 RepID=UPI001203FC28|nr:hypothetical protein [Reyranella sp.]TAJ92909.1 MAG: hypothetical protein EPO41_13450 [Reyranella sp.]TBR25852.1 MAG: hypothetical protein EPO10_23690 [Reyranella sp.]
MSIIEAFGWTMATRFEPHRRGFLYRRDRKAPPILVTAAERNAFVRAFGWHFLTHVAGFMLAVIAASMLTARFFPRGDETGGFFLMGGLLTAIGLALYLSIHWAMNAPARALAARPSFSGGEGP